MDQRGKTTSMRTTSAAWTRARIRCAGRRRPQPAGTAARRGSECARLAAPRRRLRAGVFLIVLCGLALPAAWPGPHDRGVLITHLNTELEYTSTIPTYEGQAELRDCEDAVCVGPVDPERGQVWFVLASFENSPGPVDLGGAQFGFESYDTSRLQFVDYGACNEGFLEIPTSGWPGPSSGTALVFERSRQEDVVELYWFASYVYGEVAITLAPCPDAVGGIAFSTPPPDQEEDVAFDFGKLGFGTEGYNPCDPVPPDLDGACCIFDECFVLTEDDCTAQNGVFQGVGTDCFPNPCRGDYVDTSWGVLKRLYE